MYNEPNLLTHLNEIRKESYSENGIGISIVIYCGTFSDEIDASTVLQVQRTVVEEEVNSEESSNISGILMAQGNSILHMLEGPSESVLRILYNLSLHDDFIRGLQIGRIVLSIEDRAERSFPEWYTCFIQEREARNEDNSLESNPNICVDLASSLFEIGKKLKTESAEEVELNRYADYLPTKSLVLELCDSDDFFSLQEYVETYASPVNYELESEKTWPLERLVVY